jgi:PAS domain S-box-containing protein
MGKKESGRHAGGINHIYRTFILLCAIWTMLIFIVCITAIRNQNKLTIKFAEIDASASYNKDLAYRRWSSIHGGTYAPVTEKTTPNPYLENIEERDIVTPSGKMLTLINPAYMTRQVHELSEEQYGVRGHITSLNPIRPGNAPAPWEAEALKSFEKGEREYTSVDRTGQEEYLRFMRPMITEKSCLKCHGAQGYKEGDIRGGISISVPLSSYNALGKTTIKAILIIYSTICVLGLVAIGIIFFMHGKQHHIQKIAEEQLRFQAKLLDAVEQSIVATDLNGKIVYCNPYSENIYGWKRSEVIGHDLMKLVIPESNIAEAMKDHVKILEGKSWSEEVMVKNRSGNILPALVSASPVYNENGEITGGIAISIDLTEKKKLEAQLQQTQKMEGIGILAGGIAHDFNNILAPIILHSQMAMDDIAPENPLQSSMQEIYRAAVRARDLVRQILTFARKGQDSRIVLRASLAVKEAIKFLRATIPATIEIRSEIKTDHDAILANPTHINQIVMNLCANAAYAMKEKGGIITLILDNIDINDGDNPGCALAPGKYFRLSVSDTGPGIPPDIIDRIFEPYFTTKGPGEGTGLGLAIIHGIVKSYDGGIAVESAPERGTTFLVYLPLVDENAFIEEEKESEMIMGKERILFVDDEDAAITAMEKILTRLGYNTTASNSSPDAFNIFKSNPAEFDLLITDMTMPNMTGMELIREIRAIRPDIPVILCTGFSDQIDDEKVEKAGVNVFLIKPVSMQDIAGAIRKVLDKVK